MTNLISPVKIHGNSSLIQRMRTTSSMTTKSPKRKQPLIFALVSAGGMIRIHQSMKTIQASFLERNLPYPRLPQSRDQSKRRKSSRTSLISGTLMISLRQCVPTQQVVHRKGQPTATPILIYEDTRREVVQQCIANLISTFHVYPHSEIIANSFTDRFEDMLSWLIKMIKPNAIPANTGEHGLVTNSLNISIFCIRNCQMRLTRANTIRLGISLLNTISRTRLWN